MRILVTGHEGFIGSHTTDYLLSQGHQVIGIDNIPTGNLDHQKHNGNLHSLIGNIKETILMVPPVDAIVHLAAFNSIPKSINNPDGYIRNNISAMQEVLEFAKRRKIKKVVYASSSSVTNKIPSPYSISKQMNELQAHTYAEHYGLHCVGLRFFNIFGPRQKFKDQNAPVIPKWIYQMSIGDTLIMRDGDKVSRDFTFVDNATLAISKSIDFNPTKLNLKQRFDCQYSNVVEIGCGESVSLLELYNYILKHHPKVNMNFEMKYDSLRKGEKSYSKANISKAKEIIGYEPRTNWKEGIRITLEESFKKNQML